jgi:VanZ family protein
VKRLFWLWAPPVLYAAAIFILSSRAVPMEVAPPPGFDKLVHFGVFAGLGALLARAFVGAGVRAAVLWATLAGAAYGVVDEIHQSFVPTRSAEALDALADAAGSLAGAALWAWGAARLAALRARR